MKTSILSACLLTLALSHADNTSLSMKLGQYYFTGISSNGFLGAGEQKLPKGLLGHSFGLEYRMNHNLIDIGIMANEENDVKWYASTTFFTRDGGNSAFLKGTFVKKWLHEENWDWNENDNFTYINERNRSLIIVDVGYRMDFDWMMVDASVGVAKGLDSFRLANPMPVLNLGVVVPLYRNKDSKMEDFQ
jgi:hypothetical protein